MQDECARTSRGECIRWQMVSRGGQSDTVAGTVHLMCKGSWSCSVGCGQFREAVVIQFLAISGWHAQTLVALNSGGACSLALPRQQWQTA